MRISFRTDSSNLIGSGHIIRCLKLAKELKSRGLGATKYLNLSDDDSEGTASTIWNDTTPTEDVFSIGSDSSVSANNDLFVAYCFHSVSNYCKVGSYTGTGGSGNAQDIGFQPGFIIFKNTDGQNSWWMFDSESN